MKTNNLVKFVHIGKLINLVMKEKNLDLDKVVPKMNLSVSMIKEQLNSSSIDVNVLLKWCKVLRYDFFRLYSSHLMLHHGISNTVSKKDSSLDLQGINIRKNVYTKERIQFLIKKVRTKEMTSMQIIKIYGVPKTTFYKWLQKYPNV